MTNHLTILRDRVERARTKVQRLEKSLESAGLELSDLMTALRVIEGIELDGDSNAAGTHSTSDRQNSIVRLLGVGLKNARAPADLYAAYCQSGGEDITIDTFRTTIWRMKGKAFLLDDTLWEVSAGNGMYWKSDESRLPEQDLSIDEMLGDQPRKENEPRSVSTSGPDADLRSVRTGAVIASSTPSWLTG